ncbi:MAG: MerR family transcriptional regulator [Clostridia bacterium]|nr:MerR family transcriptional regulator [Clostridia bacterium]MDY5554565.1 MerR family transcriptional regulator [Blautia sp.]
MEQRYTVTQASEILGIKAYVLRYWEEELELRIHRNEQGHRYYTGYDITLFANIRELKNRGLQLRAIKEVLPKISQIPPGSAQSRVKLIEGESEAEKSAREVGKDDDKMNRTVNKDKIVEFQKILERLITQEMQMKKTGEDRCRNLDEAIRSRQLARKEAAATQERKTRKKHFSIK